MELSMDEVQEMVMKAKQVLEGLVLALLRVVSPALPSQQMPVRNGKALFKPHRSSSQITCRNGMVSLKGHSRRRALSLLALSLRQSRRRMQSPWEFFRLWT